MTTPVEQQEFKKKMEWLVSFDDKPTTVSRPSLQAACRGNDRIAGVLHYFIYEASNYAKKNKLSLEGCKVVTLTKTHDEILHDLNKCVSEKTLISYFKKLNDWELVGSQPFHKDYKVNIEKINETVKTPPAIEKRTRKTNTTSKGCNFTTSTKLQPSNVVSVEKFEQLQSEVVTLQEIVYKLQTLVVTLQENVVTLQSSKSSDTHVQATSTDVLTFIEYRDSLRTIENKETFVGSSTDETATSSFPLSGNADPLAIGKERGINIDESPIANAITETANTDDTENRGKRGGRRKKADQPELLPEEAARLQEEKEQEKQAEERRKNIRLRIEKRRGYAFKDRKFLNECVYVKKLSEEWNDSQIEAFHKYLFERDFKWSKPDNKFKIGAYEIYENAQSIAQILRDERIAKEQGKSPTDITAWRKPSQHSDDPNIAATPGAQYILDAINEASEANIANFNEADYLAAIAR